MNAGQRVIAEQWAGRSCTLNDKPAIVSGKLNPVATVVAYEGPVMAEFSWETVQKIMLAGGNFKA